DVTSNEAYLPDPFNPGKYVTLDHPSVEAFEMKPPQVFERYGDAMRSQGKLPNSGPPDGIPTELDIAASRTGTMARVGGAVTRGLGVVAAIGGGIQFAGGVQEWRNGDKGDGAVDMTCGALNTAGGLAMATGVGAVAAPFLFGASSEIDGFRDIVHGVKNGD